MGEGHVYRPASVCSAVLRKDVSLFTVMAAAVVGNAGAAVTAAESAAQRTENDGRTPSTAAGAAVGGDGRAPADQPSAKRQRTAREGAAPLGSAATDADADADATGQPAYHLLRVNGIPERANKCDTPNTPHKFPCVCCEHDSMCREGSHRALRSCHPLRHAFKQIIQQGLHCVLQCSAEGHAAWFGA